MAAPVRRVRARRVRALLAAALVVASATACSAIPGAGAALDVRQITDQVEQTAPQAPQPGQQPDQIVRGFISASARPDRDAAAGSSLASARQYLTPQAQVGWPSPDTPVLLLADGYRTDSDEANPGSVTVTGPEQGMLREDRSFAPPAAGQVEPFSYTMTLEQVDGEWRISDPPPQLLVQQGDFAGAYQRKVLYFLDASGTVVVPDPRYLVVSSTEINRADRLMDLLLDGPSAALRGAAVSQFGTDAALRSNVTAGTDGILHVDLTGVDVSTPALKRALTAQIVWTLYTTSPRIAITVDGQPLDPAQPVSTVATVSSFDPDRVAGTGQVASDPYFVDPTGDVVGLNPGALRWDQDSDLEVSTAALSAATGAVAAVAADPAGGQQLLVGLSSTAGLQAALRADTLTAPAFTRTGDEVWVVQNGASRPEIYRVATAVTGGTASRVRVESTALAGIGPVTALALSPDGVRVAVVAGERLYVGVISPVQPTVPTEVPPTAGAQPDDPDAQSPATVAITNLVEIRPDLMDVGAVAFSSSRELTVAGATSPVSRRTLWNVGVDGRDLTGFTTAGIFGDVQSLAVSSGAPPLIGFGDRIWRLDGSASNGQWDTPNPNAPALNGSAPFYPS